MNCVGIYFKDDLLRSATPHATTPVDILHQATFNPSTAPMDHTLGIIRLFVTPETPQRRNSL